MSKFVVTIVDSSYLEEVVGEYGGEVVEDSKVQTGPMVGCVVKFDDEDEGQAFSHRVNGTVYRAEWAAREKLRDATSGSGA